MTKIKLCGLSWDSDIQVANDLMVEFVGFVFYEKSHRYVSYETAKNLKSQLSPNIKAVGVFIDEDVNQVAKLLCDGIIDIAQLHGDETQDYIETLRKLTGKPIIKAYKISTRSDIEVAEKSPADYILLDSGTGGGKVFDWGLLKDIKRRYFLAGGLNVQNVAQAIDKLHPFAVDVSSGIETNKIKDKAKMIAFVNAVRQLKGK